jgi:hypothetical protein
MRMLGTTRTVVATILAITTGSALLAAGSPAGAAEPVGCDLTTLAPPAAEPRALGADLLDDGSLVVFSATDDLTGENIDGSAEVFAFLHRTAELLEP